MRTMPWECEDLAAGQKPLRTLANHPKVSGPLQGAGWTPGVSPEPDTDQGPVPTEARAVSPAHRLPANDGEALAMARPFFGSPRA